jgi:hypothetical protein
MQISASRHDRRLRVQAELDSIRATVERLPHGWRVSSGSAYIVLSDLADLAQRDLKRLRFAAPVA